MRSRITISSMAARAASAAGELDSESDEEPGEVIESAPPMEVGEERIVNKSIGLRKKLIKKGTGWLTPQIGDEVTVHYEGMCDDRKVFDSSRERGEPFTFLLGKGMFSSTFDEGILAMTKEELALFTLPSALVNEEVYARWSIPRGADVQFEIELMSWFTVVDISKDGGIVKKILAYGDDVQTNDLDEVLVKYKVRLQDETVVAESTEDGLWVHVNEAVSTLMDTRELGRRSAALKDKKKGKKALDASASLSLHASTPLAVSTAAVITSTLPLPSSMPTSTATPNPDPSLGGHSATRSSSRDFGRVTSKSHMFKAPSSKYAGKKIEEIIEHRSAFNMVDSVMDYHVYMEAELRQARKERNENFHFKKMCAERNQEVESLKKEAESLKEERRVLMNSATKEQDKYQKLTERLIDSEKNVSKLTGELTVAQLGIVGAKKERQDEITALGIEYESAQNTISIIE